MKNTIKFLALLLIVLTSCKKDPIDPLNAKKETIYISEDIIVNTTWKTNNCYIIEKDLDVKSNAILTIEEGVTVLFENGVELTISLGDGYGTIVANGTEENPILFTSSSSLKQKGNWDGFRFFDGSSGSTFNFCNFEYGGGLNSNYGMIHLRGSDIAFTNCSFSNSDTYGISVDEGSKFNSFENNSISDCDQNPIVLHGIALHTLGSGNTYDVGSTILVEEDWIDITGEYTWSKQMIPYIFEGSMNIGSTGGTTITIEPGTEIRMGSGADLYVCKGNSNFGVLKAIGTATEPITFTSSSPFPAAGDWNGIWFETGTSAGTTLEYCVISFGGGYAYGGNINFPRDVAANVSISNCTVSNSEKYGVYKNSPSYLNPVLTNITYDSNVSGDTNF